MQTILNTLESVLQNDKRLLSEGKLLKNKVTELAFKLDAQLIRLLLSDDKLKEFFFADIDGVQVFDRQKFQLVVSNKTFLPDSYTAYKSKIGLIDEAGEFISKKGDIELVWAYKDCILEGGQTKDDQKRDEIFWNETLAPEQRDRLLDPKVITGAKRYTADGVLDITEIDDTDNLIIKGNNLLALASLMKKYEGKVKCICIDPPYNKETNEFGYNDNFNHSTWLTFMKTRLQYARKLLDKNGTIFIFCDDSEQAYLRVLTDDIFERDRYIQTVVWKNCDNSNNDAKQFSQDHNYILVYSNNENWVSLKLDRTPEQARHYKNPDNDPRGAWFDGNPVNSPNPRKNLMYTITAPNGNIIHCPPNGWRWDYYELKKRMETGEIRFNNDNTGIVRRTYLNEQDGLPPSSLWDTTQENMWVNIKETGHTRQAKYEQKKLFPTLPTNELFKTPKPEKVIERIIRISTKEDDIVLDFFGGSGTTAAVAHKMKRRYILCEQMDYISSTTIGRMKKVIDGEQGGISKAVNWKGGGSFVYFELMRLNQKYIDDIAASTTDAQLAEIWTIMKDTAYLSYKVEVTVIDEHASDFEALSLDDKKKFLVEVLDKNMLYINYCDINDGDYVISENDKLLNKSFYERR